MCHRPSVVLRSVSAEASAANQSAPTSIAVRQQPEQPIEAPMGIAAVSDQGAVIASRISALPPRGVMARTVPRAVTMPVNIQVAEAIGESPPFLTRGGWGEGVDIASRHIWLPRKFGQHII